MTDLHTPRKPRKDGNIIINLSFTPEEYDLINFVDNQDVPFAKYVKQLIKDDMERQDGNVPQEIISLDDYLKQLVKDSVEMVLLDAVRRKKAGK